jgi:hypothetical protein
VMLWKRTSRSPIALGLSPVPPACVLTPVSATVASVGSMGDLRRSCHGHASQQQTDHERFWQLAHDWQLRSREMRPETGANRSTIESMRSMDTPAGRSFKDVHDFTAEARVSPGVPDGRARSPAELFDNLRLRLSELPASHPSAMRQAGQPASAGDRALSDCSTTTDPDLRTGDGAPGGRKGSARHDSPLGTDQDDRRATPAMRGAEDTRTGEQGDAGRAGPLDEVILAVRMARDTFPGAADAGALAMTNIAAEIGPSEAYAPWFMSGDETVPWWAAGDDLWG